MTTSDKSFADAFKDNAADYANFVLLDDLEVELNSAKDLQSIRDFVLRRKQELKERSR